jgi:hypothetical protein
MVIKLIASEVLKSPSQVIGIYCFMCNGKLSLDQFYLHRKYSTLLPPLLQYDISSKIT